MDLRLEFSGGRILFDRAIQYLRLFGGGSGFLRSDFELDFGDTPRTTTFTIGVFAFGISEFRVLDMSGDDPVVLYEETDITGLWTSETITTAEHEGVVRFRVEVKRDGGGMAAWWAFTGPDVELLGFVSSGGKKNGGGCAAPGAPGTPVALGVALGLWLWRRKRRASCR